MALETFGDDGSDFNPAGMFKDLVDGVHHVVLKSTEKSQIKNGPDTLKGNPQITWKFKVIGGPSDGSGLWFSTPLSGYVMSKKTPGLRVNMSNITRKVVAALNPTWTDFTSFDPEELLGKEAEINIVTKKNTDGTVSVWLDRFVWIRPWFDQAGPSIMSDKAKEDNVDPSSVHF